jgi:hypothetical protein
MLKKIAIGALLTGLVAVLIVGAVNRTNAVSGEGAGETGRRGQVTESVTADAVAQGSGGRWSETETPQGATGRGGGGGRWAQGGSAEGGPGAGSALEQAPAGQSGVPQADVQPDEWRTLQGAVVSVADDLVEIQTAAGEVIPFEGRPLSYALEQGFSLKVGDAVTLAGFDEDGEFKLGKVTSLGNGASITLRDASGRPGWSGRGRQG